MSTARSTASSICTSDSEDEQPLGQVIAKQRTVQGASAASASAAESETELLDTDDEEARSVKQNSRTNTRLTKNNKHTTRSKRLKLTNSKPDLLANTDLFANAAAILRAEDARDSQRCREIKRQWLSLFDNVARRLANIEAALAASDRDGSDKAKQQYAGLKEKVDQLYLAMADAESERPQMNFIKRFNNDKLYPISALFDALVDRKEKVSREILALGK
jgi:hypothetical protein